MTQKRLNEAKDLIKNRVGEIGIYYKEAPAPLKERVKITCSRDAYEFYMSRMDPKEITLREFFGIMFMDRGNKVKGYEFKLFSGGVHGALVDPELLAASAALMVCSSAIIFHNHPSGQLHPSEADNEITKKISAALSTVEVRLLDHLIVSPYGGYLSYADDDLIHVS